MNESSEAEGFAEPVLPEWTAAEQYDQLAMSEEGPPAPVLPPLPPPIQKTKVKFRCPHCRKTLKVASVRKRTRVTCPKCGCEFSLYPDGRRKTVKLPPKDLSADPDSEPGQPSEDTDNLPTAMPLSSPSQAARALNIDLPPETPDSKLPAKTNLFETGEYDGTQTGFGFETVAGFDGSNLGDLREAAGLDDNLPPAPDYDILPPSGEHPSPKAAKRKSRKKPKAALVDEDQGFAILQSDEQPSPLLSKPVSKKSSSKKSKGSSRSIKKKSGSGSAERAHRKAKNSEAPDPPPPSFEASGSQELDPGSMESLPPAELSPGLAIFVGLLISLPILSGLVFLASTSRERGFAVRGEMGQQLQDLGQKLENGVTHLNDMTLQAEVLKSR